MNNNFNLRGDIMARSILPNNENEYSVTPRELLRYVGPDALRQMLRQEHLHMKLKVNRETEYQDPRTNHKFASKVYNDGDQIQIELRTYPDSGASGGYAGITVDSGLSGIPHYMDKWPETITTDSMNRKINRVVIGASANILDKSGCGIESGADGNPRYSESTSERMAGLLFDPADGRAYVLSNDTPEYINNEGRPFAYRIPGRAIARICDVPTRMTQLENDMGIVSDPNFTHTDNNFSASNRFVTDNLDDRTFVYPEISKDRNGNYIENIRIGLNGVRGYGESDGSVNQNTHEDPNNDRRGAAVSSYGANLNTSGVYHQNGYLPGIFSSLEELEKVDLLHQRMLPLTHASSPGPKRAYNYYLMDGEWTTNVLDNSNPSYRKDSINPSNMEVNLETEEPTPFSTLGDGQSFDRSKLYQWRYNRIDVAYPSTGVDIQLSEPGVDYQVGDNLRWTYGNDVFIYKVTEVGNNGEIISGYYNRDENAIYDSDPSTHGVAIEFINTSSIGHGARFKITAVAGIAVHATQIKNNLYAYVDIAPTVRSDNTSVWSDNKSSDSQGGRIAIRSTAASPAYSGINSGRGGESPSEYTSNSTLYEHGGNPTAGVHVHLFRYVINTQTSPFEEVDGVKVYTGQWVDQGPLGIERPCDIKALLFSNPDTNNFNNYYKFSSDLIMDTILRNPDAVTSHNPNALSFLRFHIDQNDPDNNTNFIEKRINPNSGEIIEENINNRVLYINGATGNVFVYNSSYKNDITNNQRQDVGWIRLRLT